MAKTCNCLDDIPRKVMEFKKREGLNVIKAQVEESAFFFSGGIKTISHIELTVEHMSKKQVKSSSVVKISMVHSYCPFCGTKYETETEPKLTTNESK